MIYTVGHSNRTHRELLALLRDASIEQLVDVRSSPGSRRHPHFARQALERALPADGIAYRWMPELGGRRKSRRDSVHIALRGSGFTGYAEYMFTEEFAAAVADLRAHASRMPTAMMCAEGRPEQCHRRFLCDWLHLHGVAVTHLVSIGEQLAHALNPLARVDGDRLLYDRGQLSLLR